MCTIFVIASKLVVSLFNTYLRELKKGNVQAIAHVCVHLVSSVLNCTFPNALLRGEL